MAGQVLNDVDRCKLRITQAASRQDQAEINATARWGALYLAPAAIKADITKADSLKAQLQALEDDIEGQCDAEAALLNEWKEAASEVTAACGEHQSALFEVRVANEKQQQ